MLSVSPRQIQHIERRYAKANDEFRDEYLQRGPAQRLEASIARTIDRAELLYGKLDDAQRRQVGVWIAQSPFDAEMWFTERQRRQQDALQMMRRLSTDAGGRDQAQAALRAYIDRSRRSPREEYRRYSATLATFNCDFAAKLHNTTSATQRQNALQRLNGWEGDMRALAGDAAR